MAAQLKSGPPPLQCGYENGSDRLHLRVPVEVTHIITSDSPLATWLSPGGMLADLDSEIVVVVSSGCDQDPICNQGYCA
jgi:hypothetical protein